MYVPSRKNDDYMPVYRMSSYCKTCDKFMGAEFFSSHMLKHKAQPFQECRFCDKIFKRKGAKEKHETDFHINAAVFECDYCHEMFSSKQKMRQHVVRHGEKLFSCEWCDFKGYTQMGLAAHKAKHSKRFNCDYCDKEFVHLFQLKLHTDGVHLNLRPHVCNYCGKRFKSKPNLAAHQVLHRDVRRYQCPHCDHKSRKKYDLNLHIRTHTKEKPFECEYCGKCFAQKGDKIKHRRLHFKQSSKEGDGKLAAAVVTEGKNSDMTYIVFNDNPNDVIYF